MGAGGERRRRSGPLTRPNLAQQATGQNAVWYLNGASVVGYSELPTVPDLGWRLMTALDIDNDGSPEMIWRHANGGNYVWYLDGGTVVNGVSLPTVLDKTWQMIGAR